jgi:hypothetical protein
VPSTKRKQWNWRTIICTTMPPGSMEIRNDR